MLMYKSSSRYNTFTLRRQGEKRTLMLSIKQGSSIHDLDLFKVPKNLKTDYIIFFVNNDFKISRYSFMCNSTFGTKHALKSLVIKANDIPDCEVRRDL